MIENPGKTPDPLKKPVSISECGFSACLASVGLHLLSTSQYVEAAVRSKWKASGGGHCSHWRGH